MILFDSPLSESPFKAEETVFFWLNNWGHGNFVVKRIDVTAKVIVPWLDCRLHLSVYIFKTVSCNFQFPTAGW